ncbi:MAG: DUF2391 family protein [Candidatus Altiarchaeota archaeon]
MFEQKPWKKRKFNIHISHSRFSFHDFLQQVVGAMILSAPFIVTQEVWELAKDLDTIRITIIIPLTVFLGYFVLKYTHKEKTCDMPQRMFSLIIVSYTCSFFVLSTVGIIGNIITDTIWAAKLVVLVSLFSTIGAATADTLIFR